MVRPRDGRGLAPPQPHKAAMFGLIDVGALKDARLTLPFAFEDAVLEGGVRMCPEFASWAVAFVRECHGRGIPMYVHTGLRSAVDQLAAFKAGRSKAPPGLSPHNHGYAVDVVHLRKGWDLSHEQWAIIGAIGKEIARRRSADIPSRKGVKVDWGGDFKSLYDPAHWEFKGWRQHLVPHHPPSYPGLARLGL